MNPLTNVKNINKLNDIEAKLGVAGSKSSWHEQYKDSAYIFIGGLPFDLTEGDIICIFSQYGEIVNVNLVRDKKSGKSKGYCFIAYEDQRSTTLAVDNFNGIKILGRTIRVDHVSNYRKPKDDGDEDDITKALRKEGCAPRTPSPSQSEDEVECVAPTTKVKKAQHKKDKKKKKNNKKDKSMKHHTENSDSDMSSSRAAESSPPINVKQEIDQGYSNRSRKPQHDRRYTETSTTGRDYDHNKLTEKHDVNAGTTYSNRGNFTSGYKYEQCDRRGDRDTNKDYSGETDAKEFNYCLDEPIKRERESYDSRRTSRDRRMMGSTDKHDFRLDDRQLHRQDSGNRYRHSGHGQTTDTKQQYSSDDSRTDRWSYAEGGRESYRQEEYQRRRGDGEDYGVLDRREERRGDRWKDRRDDRRHERDYKR